MEALKAVGICRNYGSQEVLKGMDLCLEPGAFEALMGPSGCGKSTFLHIAAGLLDVSSGSIFIGGENISRMNDAAVTRFRRRHVGVVFQAFNLLNEKTVLENVLLPIALDSRGQAKSGPAVERARCLLARLGLSDSLDKRPEQLSGGEQQRVAIARALVSEPDIVLADEPTGNLDTQSAKLICDLLKELNRTEKSAILLVTHDPMVAACATRVHFLKNGVIASSFNPNGDVSEISRLYLETYR